MTIGSCDILQYAFCLNKKENIVEVERRNIVGRAYYAVFHTAMDYVEFDLKIDLAESKMSTHSKLFDALKNYSTSSPPLKSKLQALARELKKLHSHRVASDYNLGTTVTQSTVDLVLAEANRLTKKISELQALAA